MRQNLVALQHTDNHYETLKHISLFQDLKNVGRDHYHHREGIKDDMPFICLVKADFSSSDYFFKGHIGGRDDNFIRETELIDIKFTIKLNELNRLIISIESSDRITTYEQSMKLILHSLNEMSKKTDDLNKKGGGANGKKGFYPVSAMNTGRFSTFDKWFDKAHKELVLPESLRSSFIEMNYNLLYFKG